jgi:hypothetical protein
MPINGPFLLRSGQWAQKRCYANNPRRSLTKAHSSTRIAGECRRTSSVRRMVSLREHSFGTHLLGETVALGFNRDDPTDDNPFPDAWCDNCELIRAIHNGWNLPMIACMFYGSAPNEAIPFRDGASIPGDPGLVTFSRSGLLPYAVGGGELLVYVFNPHTGLLTAKSTIADPTPYHWRNSRGKPSSRMCSHVLLNNKQLTV